MTFSLTCVLNVAFVAQYHIDEIRSRTGDMMPYTYLVVNRPREKKKCRTWLPL